MMIIVNTHLRNFNQLKSREIKRDIRVLTLRFSCLPHIFNSKSFLWTTAPLLCFIMHHNVCPLFSIKICLKIRSMYCCFFIFVCDIYTIQIVIDKTPTSRECESSFHPHPHSNLQDGTYSIVKSLFACNCCCSIDLV